MAWGFLVVVYFSGIVHNNIEIGESQKVRKWQYFGQYF